jgi:Tol biopolymer transport system component
MKKLMLIFVFCLITAFQGAQDHTLIIKSPLEERTPALSPDGTKLAFLRSSDNERNLELVIHNIKTMQQHIPNINIAVNSPPVWYNDNKRLIASVKQSNGSYKLAIIDSETGNISTPLFSKNIPVGDQLFPDLSDDNTKIAFSVLKPAASLKDPRPNFDIIVVDTITKEVDIAVSTPYRDMWPRFGAANSGLYFFSRFESKGEHDDIFHVELASKRITKIVDSSGNDFVPSISPDGMYLAYASNRSGEPAIYIHDLETSENQRLTKPGLRAAHPVWAHNGQQIYFTARVLRGRSSNGRADIAFIPIKLLHLLDK